MFGKKNGDKICVSVKEAYEINKKWKILNYALEELEEENLKLKEEVKSLKKEIEKQNRIIKDYEKDEPFFDTIDKLRNEIRKLKKENLSIRNKNSFLIKVNSSLFSILSDLEKQNRKLLQKSVIAKKQYELETKKILLKLNSLKNEIKSGRGETNDVSEEESRLKYGGDSTPSKQELRKTTSHKKKNKTGVFGSIDVKA